MNVYQLSMNKLLYQQLVKIQIRCRQNPHLLISLVSQHTNSDIKSQLTDKRFHSLILTVSLHSTCGLYSQTTDKLFLLILLSLVNRQPFSFTDIVGLLQSLILTNRYTLISVASLQLSVYICQSTVVSLQLSVYKQNNLFKWRTYCIFQHIELSEPLDNKTKLLTEIQNQIIFFHI